VFSAEHYKGVTFYAIICRRNDLTTGKFDVILYYGLCISNNNNNNSIIMQ
jgi:hypothetical protein